MKRIGQVAGGIAAAVAGLGAAILLHPRSGTRNRRAAAGVARRRTANVATLVGASRGRDRRDARLASEVEDRLAEAFGSAAGEVRVSAHRGSVTLRGEVARLDDIDAFEAHARGIAGVDDVNNLLRLPVAVARSAAPPPASTA